MPKIAWNRVEGLGTEFAGEVKAKVEHRRKFKFFKPGSEHYISPKIVLLSHQVMILNGINLCGYQEKCANIVLSVKSLRKCI
jgi:hypothetical protein